MYKHFLFRFDGLTDAGKPCIHGNPEFYVNTRLVGFIPHRVTDFPRISLVARPWRQNASERARVHVGDSCGSFASCEWLQ